MSISAPEDAPRAAAAARYDSTHVGEKDLITMTFLILTPIIAVVGTAAWTWYHGFHLWMLGLAVAMYLAVGLSICAGYHRFFSHKTYEASAPVQLFFAVFGAMAAQNSILWWSSSHRIHHQYVDRDWDPYNIQRGFWWAHILWIFYRHPPPDVTTNAADLLKNPIVLWQDRWYRFLLVAVGFGLPTAVGAAFGDPLAGLLWGGFLRLAVIHHTTFFVNSLAHYVGEPRYNAEVSARDNWVVALLTLGEGYHSFHHRFPSDFRNGIRWYQWDPAKWFIATLGFTRLATSLRSIPPPQVEQARLAAALRQSDEKIAAATGTRGEEMRRQIQKIREHIESAIVLWRQQLDERAWSVKSGWRMTRRNARNHLREARRQWRVTRRLLA
jgi:stearoyl-CoA desaturase (delta-9 desaturase)